MTPNSRIAAIIGGWIALLPLLFLTAVSLMKYAGWRLVVGDDYFLHGQQALVSHASRMAHLWLFALVTAEIVATILLVILLPARLRLLRLMVAVLAIPVLTGAIAYALILLGHHPH